MKKKRSSGGAGAFDINLVPIIDCLTILITFMLASGAFISMGILDVGVATDAQAATSRAERPSIEVTLNLMLDHELKLTWTGKENKVIRFKNVDGKWDYDALKEPMAQLREKWPKVKTITLIAVPDIPYEEIISSMGVVKNVYKNVLLGGF